MPQVWQTMTPHLAQRGLFDGDHGYIEGEDRERLKDQLNRVRDFMEDGQWHTLPEIAFAVRANTASVSARIRDLRKAKFGKHNVERRRIPGGSGLHEYRLWETWG